MGNEKYNIKLRSNILFASIRVEEAAGHVIKLLLRTVKEDSKTLGNKSSSLSFKNKIDLLYDIEDISKDNYNNCLKFAEIRNQFIHNPSCNSFSALENENKNLLNFLSKCFPNEISEMESSYNASFFKLWQSIMGALLILKIEYNKGAENEFRRYVSSEVLKRFDFVIKLAFENWKTNNYKKIETLGISKVFLNDLIPDYERLLNYHFLEEQIKIINSVEDEELTKKQIFQRRIDIVKEMKILKEKK